MSDEPPDVLGELRARLAVTSGLDDGEYVVTSQAPARVQAAKAAQPESKVPILVTRTGLKVRTGAELSSELAGDGGIRAGARVHVVERQTLGDGTERVCLAFEGHDEPLGWVSAFVNGEANLLTEAEAQAAHAAMLAAAVTGVATMPAPVRCCP